MTSTQFTPAPRSMRIGAIFPQNEIGIDPIQIAHFATTVETLGFDHLIAGDHVILGAPDAHPDLDEYTSEHMFHEIFVLFGYLAAVTTRVELTASVLILPQRPTTLVAKQAAEVDVLSKGRLRLGVGLGWNPVEYEALNAMWADRALRFEEQIALLRALWTEPIVNVHGEYHVINRAGLNPMPLQHPIPLWIGGIAEPAVRRAARLADGFLASNPIRPHTEIILGWLVDELERNGRALETFGIEGRIDLTKGTEDDWARQWRYWRDHGASHCSFDTMEGGIPTVEAHLDLLARGMRAVETV